MLQHIHINELPLLQSAMSIGVSCISVWRLVDAKARTGDPEKEKERKTRVADTCTCSQSEAVSSWAMTMAIKLSAYRSKMNALKVALEQEDREK